MRGSTLLTFILTLASVSCVGLPTASAQSSRVLDKTQVVCASVFPCNPTTFKLLPQFANPSSLEGAFCVEFVYKPICEAAQKFKHKNKRPNRNKGKGRNRK